MSPCRSFLLSLLACTLASGDEGGGNRDWTSSDGKKIRGLMLGTEADAVAIKLADNGKTAKVPLARLSEEDRDFVTKQGWPLPKTWSKWPSDIRIDLNDIEVTSLQEDSKFIYRTPHFEIVSADQLGQLVVKDIARIFEGTYRLLAASPWGILATPEKQRFRAELYVSRDSYIQAGGPPNSAGVYLTQRKVFMVPFESLGLKQTPGGWQRSAEYTTKTLIHELTHMMMDDVVQALPMWVIEGTGEYMELIPMRIGTFSPAALPKALKEHNGSQPAHSLAETFKMSHQRWQNGGEEPSSPGNGGGPGLQPLGGTDRAAELIPQFYHAGLLLTYYFMHLDGDGDAARLQRFIAACAQNAEQIRTYEEKHKAYEAAFAQFTRHPDVTPAGNGSYRYPSTMKPPEAPPFPFDCEAEELRMLEIEILLEGRTAAQLIAEATAALEKEKLKVSGGKVRPIERD